MVLGGHTVPGGSTPPYHLTHKQITMPTLVAFMFPIGFFTLIFIIDVIRS